MALGHVLFAGREFPVTGIRLTEGGIKITWVLTGPQATASAPVTFFGDDGQGVAQTGDLELPDVPDGASLVLTNTWVIMRVDG